MEIVAVPKQQKPRKQAPKRRKQRPIGQARLKRLVNKSAAMNNQNGKTEMATIRKQLKELQVQTSGAIRKNNALSPKYYKYIAAVIDPEHHLSKLPDSLNQPCALYKSVRVIPINLDYSTNADGKFAILVRPIIGANPPSKEYSQVMISKPGCVDILNDAEYDYYSDPQVTLFYSGIGGAYATYAPNATSGYNAAVTSGTLYSANNVVLGTEFGTTHRASSSGSFFGQQVSLTTDSSTTNVYTYEGYHLSLEPSFNHAQYTNLSGWHQVTVALINPGTGAIPSTKSFFLFAQNAEANGIFTPIYVSAAAAPEYINPTFSEQISVSATPQSFLGNVYNASQGMMFKVNFYFNFKDDTKYTIAGSFVDTAAYPSISGQTVITFTKCDAPPGKVNTSSFISTLRPIAQSALLTNVSPNLYKNGTLAAASMVTGETVGFLNPTSDLNFRTIPGMSAANLDDSGRLNTAKQASTGVYTYWIPYQNVTSPTFLNVDLSNSTDYGGIAICGNVANVASSTTSQNVFFLKIVTLYEYVTPNRLIVSKMYNGETTKVVEALNSLLENKNIIFDNPAHMSKIFERLACAISPIYGISKLTGSDPASNFSKFSSVASKLLKAAPDAEGVMDLLPILASAI